MVAKMRRAAAWLSIAFVAGNAAALSRDAQEFVDIQTRIAPDQCALQKLSAQAAAAQKAGELGKRQELLAQMEPIARRIQATQPRLQELSKSVQSSSPDYQAVTAHLQQLRAKCKP